MGVARVTGSGVRPSGATVATKLVEDWARLRPDLDTWPYRIYASAGELVRVITDELEPVFVDLGIKGGDYTVLSEIYRAGPPYEGSPTELSRALHITTGAMTRRLDRLEAAGYLQRLPHEVDRRALVVRLTPAGVAVVNQAVEAILVLLASRLAPIKDRIVEFEQMCRDVLSALEG